MLAERRERGLLHRDPLFEFMYRNDIIILYEWAIASGASYLGVTSLVVVIARAVCCSSKLLEQFQVVVIPGRDS